jgi:elongation factor G
MKSYESSDVRNVAVVGQVGSGKTSLVEALAFEAKAISKKGSVTEGNTLSDTEAEEIAHHHSTTLAVTTLEVGGVKINLFDTPGSPDFAAEVAPALAASEMVVLTVSAADEIGPDTHRLWSLASENKLPVLICVTKLDRENADFLATISKLRDVLSPTIDAIDIPAGQEAAFSAVTDVLFENTTRYTPDARKTEAIPDEQLPIEHHEHEHLVEDAIEEDDALMERYLEGEEPCPDTVEALLAKRVRERKVFPALCCSSTRQVGVDLLIKYLIELGPSPKPPIKEEELLAQVVKTYSDPYLGKVSLIKVFQGELKSDESYVNLTNHSIEKLHGIYQRVGHESIPLKLATKGDVVFVNKQASLHTSDTLGLRPDQSPLPPLNLPLPTYKVVVTTPNKNDDEKLFGALLKIAEEEPVLLVGREERSHRITCQGIGDSHIANVLEKVQRRTKISATFDQPEIEYLETITKSASAEGKHKKQSGGHGQYGVVNLTIEPLPRGEGFRFVDEVVGGAIPKNFIPAVEKGVLEAMESGGPNGYPIVDILVRVIDGKYHPVDSSEMSFKLAGALALKNAVSLAEPVVLEPVAEVVVHVPSRFQGDVLGDLSSKRAQVLGTENLDGDLVAISALVPESEMSGYTIQLRSITGGRGTFQEKRHGYQILTTNKRP